MPLQPIICDRCQKGRATTHWTEITNGEQKEYHLCEACTKDIDLEDPAPAAAAIIFLGNILGKLKPPAIHEVSCPSCGMTPSKLLATSRLGCPKCYDSLGLGPLLDKIHGASKHVGKVPQSMEAVMKIPELQLRLKRVIKDENYEEAATIHKEIMRLSKDVDTHRDSGDKS